MSNWLIIGATSGIATHLARELASRGHRLCLADRDETMEKLKLLKNDITVRSGVEATISRFEAIEMDSHKGYIDEIEHDFGKIDGVVYAVGVMWDQQELQSDFKRARLQHAVNYIAAMGVLGAIADKMEQRRKGHIVSFGSPAGDRGRKTNYLYGADKAAMHIFLAGLRHRLTGKGVTVLTVKPGPVDTPMTAGMKVKFKAQPEDVARDIAKAIDEKKLEIYTPAKWRLIMLIIRHLPWCVFKRLNI